MRSVKWGAFLGWGIAIYAVVFLAWSILVIHGLIDGAVPRIILAIVLVATLIVARRNLRLHDWRDVLPYSLGWVLIAVAFDVLCAVPVSGWSMWNDWNIWVGYALVAVVPLVVPPAPSRTRRR